MTCISRPPRSLQGAGSDEAFAHAIDTDNVAMHAPTVQHCLSVRAAKNVRELRLRNGAQGRGVHILLLAFFCVCMGLQDLGSPQAGS